MIRENARREHTVRSISVCFAYNPYQAYQSAEACCSFRPFGARGDFLLAAGQEIL